MHECGPRCGHGAGVLAAVEKPAPSKGPGGSCGPGWHLAGCACRDKDPEAVIAERDRAAALLRGLHGRGCYPCHTGGECEVREFLKGLNDAGS